MTVVKLKVVKHQTLFSFVFIIYYKQNSSLEAFVFHEDDKLKVFWFEARSVVCG